MNKRKKVIFQLMVVIPIIIGTIALALREGYWIVLVVIGILMVGVGGGFLATNE